MDRGTKRKTAGNSREGWRRESRAGRQCSVVVEWMETGKMSLNEAASS